MAKFNWTVDDIKRAQRDFSNNFMRLDCIRTESYDVAIDCMTECIEKKAADVQPKSQWISVDDRLPEDNGDCLVWYRCDTAFGKSESWGIAHCSRCDWYTKHLDGDNIVVLYWIPLPELPKDGDTI